MLYNEPSPLETRVLSRRFGMPHSESIDTYLATEGYQAFLKAAKMTPDEIINEILSVAMVDIVEMLGCEQGVKYHRLLLEALKKGDKAECESLMDEHIENTIRSIVAAADGELARP